MHVNTRLEASPVAGVRILYPDGLGLVSSSLGLDACTLPASQYAEILVSTSGLGGCSPNAVMAYGTARAIVRLVQSGQIIPEYAALTVLSGPLTSGQLQLVLYIDGQHPFGARILVAGQATGAPAPFGGALQVAFPQIASLQDLATISLTDLNISIGTRRITYYAHGRPYHPDGVALPDRCPRRGFRFAVTLTFAVTSARAATAHATVPCSALHA